MNEQTKNKAMAEGNKIASSSIYYSPFLQISFLTVYFTEFRSEFALQM
jgi:hypothetical protein